jgi:hypothetical protein
MISNARAFIVNRISGRTFAMTEGEELTQHKSARRDRALRVHRFVRHRLVQMNSNKAKD